MDAIRFYRILPTALYRTTAAPSGEKFLFYLRSASAPPETLSLDGVWEGLDGRTGYLVFPNRLPSSDAGYADLEKSLAALLPKDPPKHTSFVWASVASNGTTVRSAVPLSVGGEGEATVVADQFELKIFPPLENLLIPAGTPVAAGRADGHIDRFTTTYPPLGGQPAAQAPNGIGVTVAAQGDGLGCFRFEALFNADAGGSGQDESAIKQLYRVSIDPVDLYNDQRTYMLMTGLRFRLTHDAGGYSLQVLKG